MTAKEYLQSVRKKDAEIENLQRDKEGLREMLFSLSHHSQGEQVQNSRNNDKFGTLYSRIDEKEREIVNAIDDLIDFKLKVSREINMLHDDRYINVLYKRYIQKLSWEQIAVDTGYEIRHIYRIHGQALLEFEKRHRNIFE